MDKLMITIIFSFYFQIITIAQNQASKDLLTMAIDMNDTTGLKIDYDLRSKLASKIINIVSINSNHCKMSCVRRNNILKNEKEPSLDMNELSAGILCKPQIDIFDEGILETGMEKIAYVKLNVSIFIQSVKGSVIFSSTSKEYMGTGKNKNQAINNAIVNINVNDIGFRQFLEKSRQEIVTYYDQMCESILSQASILVKFNKHVDAIVLLWPIPREVTCHQQVRDSLVSIYRSWSENKCANNIYNAKTYFANNEFSVALAELYKIDAQSSCAKEALELMDKIALKVDLKDEQKRKLEEFKYLKENELELARVRNQRMSSIVDDAMSGRYNE
jgi:hypothetical protein